MNAIIIRIIITSALFILMLGSGIWLAKLGRALNNVIFGAHKIMALAALVFTVISAIYINKQIESTKLIIFLLIVSGILWLIALVSGSLLSFEKFETPLIEGLHKYSTWVVLLSTAASFFILIKEFSAK